MQLTTKEIQIKLANTKTIEDPFIEECKADSRKGVQQLVTKWIKQYEHEKRLHEQFHQMLHYEQQAKQKGHRLIAGIDEVGRGPLAGPVVAAAVILNDNCYLPGLTDSKKLSISARETFFELIKENAVSIGIGIVSAPKIDELNIYEATKHAMKLAIEDLQFAPDYLLIDAMKLDVPITQQSIIKGDQKSISIAASSVIAKVTRDRIMVDIAKKYKEYGFDQNMGYGTKIHLEALKQFGVTKHHRKSFAPVRDSL
ncbi:ribonuclease HII [Metabacillus malikii]|uniref:Ribonuclease HII n=1 Tax=Metabacillus malikii TaxID=1504265 RepID=A0ABT9ZE88_9BACI|nr:ribonuclease HII [Metabacillus malikii]